jgi:1-acyl-sn-glycerol-3-phosphate acyltransferase
MAENGTDPSPEAAVPVTYRRLRFIVRLLTRIFFRRVEVTGLGNIPTDRGGILVAWHPNGMVDPGLIIGRFPHQVIFGARHGLFRWPILARVMRALGTVPIYRKQDMAEDAHGEQRSKNTTSLDALAKVIADGSFSALFPEGISHDAPHLIELKTGAARLYYQARAQTPAGQPPPVIIPVGLHYDKKRLFRSKALVVFHPPMELGPELDVTPAPDEDVEESRERARALTDAIDGELSRVIYATESWELHALLHRARKLVRAERVHRAGSQPGKASIDERVAGLARIWTGYQGLMAQDPQRVEQMVDRVAAYDEDMSALDLADHELDRAPRLLSPWLVMILLMQFVLVFFLLPPVLMVGYVINLPPAGILKLLAQYAGSEDKDRATIKIIGGAFLYPITWSIWALLAAWGVIQLNVLFPNMPASPLLAGFCTFVLGVLSGFLVIGYLRLARETLHSIRVRFVRSANTVPIGRLCGERSVLHDGILQMAEGMELPGVVHADGTVGRD